MSDKTIASEAWGSPEPFTDSEALARLIEYAREEALRTGELVCANLLGAALAALDGIATIGRERPIAAPSALGLF